MIVEGLEVTFVNGILRVETLMVKSDGTVIPSGSIEIPGNMTGEVINGLVKAPGIVDKSMKIMTQVNIKEDTKKIKANPRKKK